ncbi:hypothetical protein G6011_02918 [Alternaria panax]|uniref:Uncharacterized protein n=1 Tax=Alternaria panax TaxID=48097 RepID=A0AAD4FAT4_9PLEO|nr:hypothetical protein G6011_02918 [Alternaria panax]
MDHVAALPNETTVKDYDFITETNTKTSPLLRLPGETRNMIYEYALADTIMAPNEPIWSWRRWLLPAPTFLQGARPCGSLHQTCRQLRNETLPLRVPLKTFLFYKRCDFPDFVTYILQKKEKTAPIALGPRVLRRLNRYKDWDNTYVKLMQLRNAFLQSPWPSERALYCYSATEWLARDPDGQRKFRFTVKKEDDARLLSHGYKLQLVDCEAEVVGKFVWERVGGRD